MRQWSPGHSQTQPTEEQTGCMHPVVDPTGLFWSFLSLWLFLLPFTAIYSFCCCVHCFWSHLCCFALLSVIISGPVPGKKPAE